MHARRLLTLRGFAVLATALGVAVLANVLAAPVLLYVAVLLCALVVLAVIAVRVPRRSGTVTRRIDTDLLTVGEESEVSVRFDLRAMRAPFGAWEDQLPDAVAGDAKGDFPTDDGTHMRYTITGLRRGIWQIGPLALHTTDPFGCAQRYQEFGETRTVFVVPEIVPLTAMASAAGASGGTARTATTQLGQGSDNLSPRPYVSGDSMRRIHWRATAHRGDLMVRQEEAESSPDAIVILDRAESRWAPHGAEADAAFEAAVSACASVALHLEHEGCVVDVIDSAGILLGSLRGQEDDLDTLLVSLASVLPQGEPRPGAAVFDGTATGPLVMITGRISAEDAALLHHGGASAPVLLTTDPQPGSIDTATERGWAAAHLGNDVQSAWDDALAGRAVPGAGHVPR